MLQELHRESNHSITPEQLIARLHTTHGFLETTGFNAWDEIARMLGNAISHIRQGNPEKETLDQIFKEVEGNIICFNKEYNSQEPVLTIPINIMKVKGRERIRSLFGSKLWVRSISSLERGGIVKQTFTKLEPEIINAYPGTTFVVTNPPGWSGFKNTKGEHIFYKETQTAIIKKNRSGHLEALTVISRMNSLQNMQFLKLLDPSLRFNEEEKDYKKFIQQIVASPVTLPVENGEFSHEDVVAKIQEVLKSPYIRTFQLNGKVVRQTFSQTYALLDKKEQLLSIERHTSQVLERFKQEFKKSSVSFIQVAQQLADEYPNFESLSAEEQIILLKDQVKCSIPMIYLADALCKAVLDIDTPDSTVSYEQKTNILTEKEGCNGGGSTLTAFGLVNSESCKKIKCKKCGWKPKGIEVTAILKGILVACPECGWHP